MKSRILTCITAMTLFAAMEAAVRPAAQDNGAIVLVLQEQGTTLSVLEVVDD